MTATELSLSDLYIDASQGESRSGNAFGYIGTEVTFEDGDQEVGFTGWFFDWPNPKARISTDEERSMVLDSLSKDEMDSRRCDSAIPRKLAREKLANYLDTHFQIEEAAK